MPGTARPGKQRTKSSAKKRIRVTGTGQFIHNKASHNHLLQQKSKGQKLLAKKLQKMSSAYNKMMKRLLPNKKK